MSTVTWRNDPRSAIAHSRHHYFAPAVKGDDACGRCGHGWDHDLHLRPPGQKSTASAEPKAATS